MFTIGEKFEQFACINFCMKFNLISSTKICKRFQKAFGGHSLVETQVFQWHMCLKKTIDYQFKITNDQIDQSTGKIAKQSITRLGPIINTAGYPHRKPEHATLQRFSAALMRHERSTGIPSMDDSEEDITQI